MIVLLVFIGGVMGGMIRLLCARSLPPLWGTFTANMIACALLAWVYSHDFSPIFWGVGVAGALSTWSTLAKEIGTLPFKTGMAYLATTVACGTGVVWIFA